MKKFSYTILLLICLLTTSIHASHEAPLGFYSKLWGLVNVVDGCKFRNVDADFRIGGIASASLGYNLCYGVQLELEYAYRRNQMKKFKSCEFDRTGYYESSSYMANILINIPLKRTCLCDWKPFFGFGAGYDDQRIHAHKEFNKRHCCLHRRGCDHRRDHRDHRDRCHPHDHHDCHEHHPHHDCLPHCREPNFDLGCHHHRDRRCDHHNKCCCKPKKPPFGGQEDGFAWQFIAGVAYGITDRLDFLFMYNFHKSPLAHLDNNAFGIGLEYAFGNDCY